MIPFTKMEGLGNDFVVIEGDRAAVTPEFARRICDRRLGVGADQLLWIKKPESDSSCDARMDILNIDGSVAEMCGNGVRAAALYLHKRAKKPKESYRFETLAGVITTWVQADGEITVDMGPPKLVTPHGDAVEVAGHTLLFHEVSMGNPHAVFFPCREGMDALAPQIEVNHRFPNRTNVELVWVTGPQSLKVRVWERGAGWTLACGTGACAAAVTAIATGRAQAGSEIRVELPGGVLRIRWDGRPESSVFMTGPAREVFAGDFYV